MSIVNVIGGLVGYLTTALGVPVFVQNQNNDMTTARRYLNLIYDMNPTGYLGGGDHHDNYTIIIEVYGKSSPSATTDEALDFDGFVEDVKTALDDRDGLDLIQQAQSIKMDRGISDIRNYPFRNEAPGMFKKIITINGYELTQG